MPDGSVPHTVDALPFGGPSQVFSLKPGSARRPAIARGEGIYIWDTSGKRYIDVSSGPVAFNLGYGNKRVIAAMKAQLDSAAFAHPSQFESAANAELAGLVAKHAGAGLERVWFCSGGSEAVEGAIKFARQHAVAVGQSSRWKVLSRMPAYHGNTLGALALTGDQGAHDLFGPMMKLLPKVPTPFTYRLPPNHTAESWARHCAAELERVILAEGVESVLAFILEPVGGLATGALVSPDVYLETVREICSRHGVLLIFDEVMTGAGRTGAFLAAEHTPKARPDIVVMAKGLSAGYMPLGAVLAPAHMVAAVATMGGFMHGHTYQSNPLSCACGVAAVSETIERDLTGNAQRMGAMLKARLQTLADTSAIIGDVRGKGLLLALELVANKSTKAMIPGATPAPARFNAQAAEHGLSVYSRRTNRGTDGDWVMISPALIVTEDEIDMIVTGLEKTVGGLEAELRREGVL